MNEQAMAAAMRSFSRAFAELADALEQEQDPPLTVTEIEQFAAEVEAIQAEPPSLVGTQGVRDWIEQRGDEPFTVDDVRDAGAAKSTAFNGLTALRRDGFIKAVGVGERQGSTGRVPTLYAVAESPLPKTEGPAGNEEKAKRVARDWIVKQTDPFTRADLMAAIHVGSDRVGRLIEWAVQRGIAESAGERRHGSSPGRPAKLYRYVRPGASGAVTTRRVGHEHGNGSAAVAGTGRRRAARKDVGKVIDKLKAQGWRIEYGKNHPVAYSPDGTLVTSLPSTPSDHRALANAKAKLRKAGARV